MGASRLRAQGREAKTVEGFQFLLTPDEARLVEEALDAYRRTMREDLGEDIAYTAQQQWAYDRAGQLGKLLDAAVTGYSYKPPTAMRHQPGGLLSMRLRSVTDG